MNAPRIPAPVTGVFRQFFTGVGLLFRGLGLYVRSPGLMLLGIIPALISGILFVGAYAALVYFSMDLAEWLTPFADGWPTAWRDTVRTLTVVALLGLGGLLTVLTFTAVTLVIGDPFYEKISEMVEDRFGGTPGAVELSFWQSLLRSIGDSLRMVALSTLIGIPLFAAGFIPVVGQVVVPVIGGAIGGWFLALELVGVPFARRGLRLPDRRRTLKVERPVTLGFGVAVFVCFLIPLGAVLIMPAAVAGGTLLTRRALGQPIDEQRPTTPSYAR